MHVTQGQICSHFLLYHTPPTPDSLSTVSRGILLQNAQCILQNLEGISLKVCVCVCVCICGCVCVYRAILSTRLLGRLNSRLLKSLFDIALSL